MQFCRDGSYTLVYFIVVLEVGTGAAPAGLWKASVPNEGKLVLTPKRCGVRRLVLV